MQTTGTDPANRDPASYRENNGGDAGTINTIFNHPDGSPIQIKLASYRELMDQMTETANRLIDQLSEWKKKYDAKEDELLTVLNQRDEISRDNARLQEHVAGQGRVFNGLSIYEYHERFKKQTHYIGQLQDRIREMESEPHYNGLLTAVQKRDEEIMELSAELINEKGRNKDLLEKVDFYDAKLVQAARNEGILKEELHTANQHWVKWEKKFIELRDKVRQLST